MEHAYLEFRQGSSDKFYRILATQLPSGDWVTTCWWGRRGSNGQTQIKYMGPSEAAAKATVEEFYYQKTAKGYVDALDPLTPASTTKTPAPLVYPAHPSTVIQPPSPASSQLSGVPRFPAMKAKEVKVNWLTYGDFVMEEKFDGHRGGLTFNPDGSIIVRNVYGDDKGKIENMPHIEEALRDLAGNSNADLFAGTLIDGELVGLTLEETNHLLGGAGQNDPRLRFVAFDLPFLCGEDLRDEQWAVRRNLLAELFEGIEGGPVVLADLLIPTEDSVQAIWDRGGEGAILKSIYSKYVPGGRADWIKIKEHHTADAVITSWAPGAGKYNNQIGAVVLSQLKGGVWTEVTKVSGMTDAVRKELTENWGEWVGSVIEFEYQKKTDTGSYRHPRWVRPRPDKVQDDCSWETSP